ncbi:hypothetical protein CBOM_05255 [Ceraceosorus bombacis]|uniref:Uncharacterized protein n=1 Tax=Ceraceosorus bombacis TaxID=401625 RepID=A0A0P1BQ08_9BASI|nr:hypothetical protein CBOM_05255 [Ceraceosorus bombacis]
MARRNRFFPKARRASDREVITRSTSAPPLDSPARVFWGPINRRARVSPGGTLRIVTPSQELVDEVSANDDSGVLVDPFIVPSVEGTPAQLDLDISSATPRIDVPFWTRLWPSKQAL